MAPRTVGAIALCPTGNVQGGYFFFSLSSGRRINRKKWTVLPMPDETIQRIHQLACRDQLGIKIQDSTGTENMHDPPPNKWGIMMIIPHMCPIKKALKKDDDSIPSIESLNEVAIRHNTDDFEPTADVTDTADTTTTTTRDDNDTSVTAEENIPEGEGIASDTMTAGVYTPDEDTNEDSSFTTG
eukprot:1609540-Ditylum_brightwellii.AAC.1